MVALCRRVYVPVVSIGTLPPATGTHVHATDNGRKPVNQKKSISSVRWIIYILHEDINPILRSIYSARDRSITRSFANMSFDEILTCLFSFDKAEGLDRRRVWQVLQNLTFPSLICLPCPLHPPTGPASGSGFP